MLDTLGVALAGSREDVAKKVAELACAQGGIEEATLLGRPGKLPAAEAALVNGTAAHSLDYDDVQANMRGHPSVPLLPAVLALGEKFGASGRDVLDAFVIGFEIECKLGRAIGGPHYALGWHATSTLGTLGAAAACSRLLRLDAAQTQTALGIAASLASGVRQNFGTMTKPLHTGWAARNGVVAAALAAGGLTADARALEGENGFLRAMSGGAEIDAAAAVRDLGEPWEIISPGIAVKLYPCCYATHRAIDAAVAIRGASGAAIADAERVEVVVTPGTLSPLIRRLPETGLEAKFSMQYCVAAALIDGDVCFGTFGEAAVARAEVRRLMACVEVSEAGPQGQFPIEGSATVILYTADAVKHSRTVETPRGDPRNPLTWEQLLTKFRDCAGLALPEERIERAVELIERWDELPDVRETAAALSG